MRNKGFTLIELVVVIVIIGILAVYAAPRFLNLQSDARISALNGLKAAIEAGIGELYGLATIQQVEHSPNANVILRDGTLVATRFGYPGSDISISAIVEGLGDFPFAPSGNGGDWFLLIAGTSNDSVLARYSLESLYGDASLSEAIGAIDCTVTYQLNLNADRPSPTVTVDENC
ncbi:prepilin-type N-terminal cleavage/methylation domain-containing protein [Photobacterium sp. GJ3]|uniref:prepilin-type N-terminal cleavage/methylation domain-containing protein n=1 Tax=Photobacterium sp. GJ3 TaxID=2829502 RepID=UPI001B8D427A|nr:prepilin-type N-terminal cleavage/methylation domain-containing protein [Photobacterium sp. GJ3]QUJ67533.1 prepilin-type N-terminal cleavage/methylation domain-containing protein [Photobacterium sp. GJ3]